MQSTRAQASSAPARVAARVPGLACCFERARAPCPRTAHYGRTPATSSEACPRILQRRAQRARAWHCTI
eukprot:8904652-Alexandrium_andersonii.AAC.1